MNSVLYKYISITVRDIIINRWNVRILITGLAWSHAMPVASQGVDFQGYMSWSVLWSMI